MVLWFLDYIDALEPALEERFSNRKSRQNSQDWSRGHCMRGAMTMQAAAALPARIGAGASLHGGRFVPDKPDSPHLLVPKIKAQYYFGVAPTTICVNRMQKRSFGKRLATLT